MKNLILFILIFIASISIAKANQSGLSTQLNQILKHFDRPVSLGIMVKDQQTGQILFQKNADNYFMPASNEKLLTAFAALLYLGDNFTYQTRLFADTTKIQNGILNDNVYLQFSGDPEFTMVQLERLIKTLSQAGIKQINGKLSIDDSAFDQTSMSPGTTWDDKDYCWGAPVSAIIIDKNCVKTTLVPAVKPSVAARMTAPAYPQSMTYINNVTTALPNADKCVTHVKRGNQNAYVIDGCIHPVPTKPRAIENSIDDARANLQFLLIYLLDKNKIASTKSFEFAKITNAPPLLASQLSPPLHGLIKKMLKESDNMIANALFKTMGMVYSKDSGTFENGSAAVRDMLVKSIKLEIPDTTVVDGDGTSRYDFLTPNQLVTLLQSASTFKHAELFHDALPIGGIDGTLAYRMKTAPALGQVYAKTGSETAVSTLSGYLETNKRHHLVFSIMINGFVDLPKKYQDLEDRICETLIENG